MTVSSIRLASSNCSNDGHLIWNMANAAHRVFGNVNKILPCGRVSLIFANCSRTILINPGADRSLHSVANCEAMDDRLSKMYPLRLVYTLEYIKGNLSELRIPLILHSDFNGLELLITCLYPAVEYFVLPLVWF